MLWQIAGVLAPVGSLNELRTRLLGQRAVVDAESFFDPKYQQDIPDPLLLVGMAQAVDRIFAAILAGEHIVIHGDYDADGITSTTILLDVLQQLGAAVTPFIPDRADGYGLHQPTLEHLIPGVSLVITVDCGISNHAEIAWLRKQDIDTIVIDHHSVPAQLPPAHTIIHPAHPDGSYPFSQLCGAGVAWKVATALLQDTRSPAAVDTDAPKWLLDLAALGTIADLVPLVGENRAIVQFGLEVIRRTKRPGIRALLAEARLDTSQLTAKDLSWRVIPLLNAAGRMDHAQPALDLLLAQSDDVAQMHLAVIKGLDQQRRLATKQVVAEAEAQVDLAAPFVFAHHASWPPGVVGLVANQLLRKFGRPAVVIGGAGDQAVGSVRTAAGVSALAMLQSATDILVKFGGHTHAAGFTVASVHISTLATTLKAHTSTWQTPDDEVLEVAAAIIDPALLTSDTSLLVQQFAPFGMGNELPRFVIKNLALLAWRPVGKTQEHAKCTFRLANRVIDGIGFGLAPTIAKLVDEVQAVATTTGQRDRGRIKAKSQAEVCHVDVLAEIEENEWQGRRRLQLTIHALAPAGTVQITTTGG